MMEASVNKSAKVLEAQIDMILHVRSSWQQLDATPAKAPETWKGDEAGLAEASSSVNARSNGQRVRFSQTA